MMRFSDRICDCKCRQVAHDDSSDTATVGSPNGSLMASSEVSAAEASLMRVSDSTMAAATAATMTVSKSFFPSVEPATDSPPSSITKGQIAAERDANALQKESRPERALRYKPGMRLVGRRRGMRIDSNQKGARKPESAPLAAMPNDVARRSTNPDVAKARS